MNGQYDPMKVLGVSICLLSAAITVSIGYEIFAWLT